MNKPAVNLQIRARARLKTAPPIPRETMNQRDLIRLALMLIILGLNALLSHYAFADERSSPLVDSVILASYAVLTMAVVLALQGCLCGRKAKSPRHPRLSIENVLVFVYGLGLIIFVTVYCVLGVSGDASAAFYVQLTVIALEEMFIRTKDATLRRSVLFFSALLAGFSNICSALTTSGAGESVVALMEQRWFLVVFGAVMPCAVPWVFFSVRGKRFYNPVTIYDFLNFGMPFAVIVSVMCLLSIDLVLHQVPIPVSMNQTNATGQESRLVSAADVATPLLCLNMLPTVFLAVQSILLYSTVDFLTVSAVVASFKALGDRQPSTLVILGFVASSVAFSARIYACYRDDGDKCSVVYSRECEEDEEEDEFLEKIRADIEIAEV